MIVHVCNECGSNVSCYIDRTKEPLQRKHDTGKGFVLVELKLIMAPPNVPDYAICDTCLIAAAAQGRTTNGD